LNFTAHNIELPDGTQTFPQAGGLMRTYPWFLSSKRMIEAVFPNGFENVSLADLGCLEGGYTVEFAKLGLDCLGIEARQSNFNNCEIVRSAFSLPNLRFVKDDAWNLPTYGKFDVTFCCGLLYHLDKPNTFLKMLAKQTNKLVIVQTHFAGENQAKFDLSPLAEHDGLTGRWYREYDGEFDEAVLDSARWTSWKNGKSFWPTREALLQAILDAGFDLVLEQFDGLAPRIDMAMKPGGQYVDFCRGTFVGIKL